MKEIFKPIIGYEGIYEVSNLGRVKSLSRLFKKIRGTYISSDKILKNSKNAYGYYRVDLGKNGRRKMNLVHRLVCEAFCENPHKKSKVNHIDNNIANNNASNLEWVTQKENIQHAVRQNRMAVGEKHGNSKLLENDVIEIKKLVCLGINSGIISASFNVCARTINSIKTQKTWKHIK